MPTIPPLHRQCWRFLLRQVGMENLLTTEQAAAFLNIAPGTLVVWRSTKRYAVPYVRVGRHIRYRRSALDAWLDQRAQNGSASTQDKR